MTVVELGARQLDVEVHRPPVPFVDDRAGVAAGAHEPPRHVLDRLLRGRQADTLQRAPVTRRSRSSDSARCAPRAAADHRVNLVDDDGAHRGQHLPAARRREQQIERFGVVTRMCGGVLTIAARADAGCRRCERRR
jgi:hypothetical protein